ncbi:hypothetical protein ACQPYE_08010 [Actinosynnema sp. CA-299493]
MTSELLPPRGSGEPIDAWKREADAVTLPRLADASALPRPSTVGTTYAELEHAALADEQEASWSAEGERSGRAHRAKARGVDHHVEGLTLALGERAAELREAQAAYQHAAAVLGPYVRREPGGKIRYWICWPLLVLGDTAGVWSAAVVLGDIVFIAFWQALASGVAAACAGLVGSELRDIRMARTRRRDPDDLTEDEQRYRRLFTTTDDGMPIVKLIGLLSVLVVALIGVGIFALRSSIEGPAAGLTFSLLAAATAIGSGLLGYAAADEVADLLASMAKRVRQAEKRYLSLAASPVFTIKATADETADSLTREAAHRGNAAARRVESLGWRVSRKNPHVLGHGYAVGETCGPIGWRARRGENS